ncbi:porin family protein [Seonamhaeicola sediminis]|uniref:Porin family protein n=1 Tax=Seonamhaeicola sediminis TaxID=2528206 RepID=A0A562YF44_9FLAO|nr:outer membrane beta-barrel protein [Seonamhaeicola sediminis]TWO33269.1 porin family protein [Seonamhaeicola sediminis]
MIKTILIIICLSLFSGSVISQTNEIINPKGQWYFGVEMGINKINSFNNGESNTSFQGGILAEYYFSKHWSLSVKVKKFNTGVSFFQPSSSDPFCVFCRDQYSGTFEGSVVALPFSVKWEFGVYKNLKANLKIGYAFNIETKSTYSNYSNNISIDYPKQYGNVVSGAGLNYSINKKTAIYLDVESFTGSKKGHVVNLFGKKTYKVENVLTSFGIKFNL